MHINTVHLSKGSNQLCPLQQSDLVRVTHTKPKLSLPTSCSDLLPLSPYHLPLSHFLPTVSWVLLSQFTAMLQCSWPHVEFPGAIMESILPFILFEVYCSYYPFSRMQRIPKLPLLSTRKQQGPGIEADAEKDDIHLIIFLCICHTYIKKTSGGWRRQISSCYSCRGSKMSSSSELGNTIAYDDSSRGSKALFWTQQAPQHMGIHACRHTCNSLQIKINPNNLKSGFSASLGMKCKRGATCLPLDDQQLLCSALLFPDDRRPWFKTSYTEIARRKCEQHLTNVGVRKDFLNRPPQ